MTSDRAGRVRDPIDALPQQRSAEVVRRSWSALQAIHDVNGTRIGYELFYRDSEAAERFPEPTPATTLHLLAGRTSILEKDWIPGAYQYFAAVTREFLVGELPLPELCEIAVLQVPADLTVDAAVVRGVEALRAEGYGLALDRYPTGGEHRQDALLPFASHVRIDLQAHGGAGLRETVRRVEDESNAQVIGSRISTRQLYDRAREIGCHLFQGSAVEGTELRTEEAVRGRVDTHVRLLNQLSGRHDEVDLAQVVRVVEHDPDLALRVLQACNTAEAGLVRKITSIRQAVMLIGFDRLRRRVHLALAQELGVQGESRILQMIEYATLTDLVGVALTVPPGDAYLAGLLVEVADVLGRPLGEILHGLPLLPALVHDMIHRTGPIGTAITLVDDYKRGLLTDVPDSIPSLPGLHAQAMLAAAGTTHLLGGVAPSPAAPPLPPVRSTTRAPDDLAALLGPAPSADEVAHAMQWNTWSREHAERLFHDGSISPAETAALLSVDESGLEALCSSGGLVRHDLDGVQRVPVWQFTGQGRLVDGLAEITTHFPGDAVALTAWMTRPCRRLSRRLPVTLLLEGDTDAVVQVVRGLTRW